MESKCTIGRIFDIKLLNIEGIHSSIQSSYLESCDLWRDIGSGGGTSSNRSAVLIRSDPPRIDMRHRQAVVVFTVHWTSKNYVITDTSYNRISKYEFFFIVLAQSTGIIFHWLKNFLVSANRMWSHNKFIQITIITQTFAQTKDCRK